MTIRYYILDGVTPVPVEDVITWGKWLQRADRHVKQQFVGDYRVSTVFLGLPHGEDDEDRPLLFETMVFDQEGSSEYLERCATWADALLMHDRGVAFVYNELLT